MSAATVAITAWGTQHRFAARGQDDTHAAVNVAWRNGPVENIHAGQAQAYQLAEQRVTPDEERRLMRFASDGLALTMRVCRRFAMEAPRSILAGAGAALCVGEDDAGHAFGVDTDGGVSRRAAAGVDRTGRRRYREVKQRKRGLLCSGPVRP